MSFKYFTFMLQGSGALAILVMAFTAGTAWRKQGWGDSNPVTETLASLWVFFQPLLFSLIGAEVKLLTSFLLIMVNLSD